MALNEIHILPSENTPEYIFNPDGTIKIKGRGLINTRTEVSGQIISWIDSYLQDPAELTVVSIAFEYLNSFSTSNLVSILTRVSHVIMHRKKIKIIWYYEEDDDDILERGEYISMTLNIPFNFIGTREIANSF
jgi:hypothetical protein